MKNTENKTQTHPSYGLLQFSRITGGATSLFGSSIQHRDTITMTLRNAEVDRLHSNDFYFGGAEIAKVEMSYSQFAEAITSMNVGMGVPVTIRYVKGEGRIEDCPFVDKRNQFEKEFQSNLELVNEETNNLIHELEKLFSEKKTLNKADKDEILRKLNKINMNCNSNRDFIYRHFNEQMDKTVQEAKGEIEAFAQNKIHSIATAALVESREEILKIESPVDIL